MREILAGPTGRCQSACRARRRMHVSGWRLHPAICPSPTDDAADRCRSALSRISASAPVRPRSTGTTQAAADHHRRIDLAPGFVICDRRRKQDRRAAGHGRTLPRGGHSSSTLGARPNGRARTDPQLHYRRYRGRDAGVRGAGAALPIGSCRPSSTWARCCWRPLAGGLALMIDGLCAIAMPVFIGHPHVARHRGQELHPARSTSRWRRWRRACRYGQSRSSTRGTKRAQPIVMTTVAMVAGMVPTAFSLSGDSSSRTPMGIVVIGGLTVSTILTLVIVPRDVQPGGGNRGVDRAAAWPAPAHLSAGRRRYAGPRRAARTHDRGRTRYDRLSRRRAAAGGGMIRAIPGARPAG